MNEDEMLSRLRSRGSYDVLVKALFQLLDRTEETDDGRSFHPNQLRSCRALDAEKLSKILAQLKNMVEGNNT